MSETISLIICLNYLWSFQTPPPNLVHVKRNSMFFKFWHIGHTGTVRCQEHVVYHRAFVIGIDIIQFGAATFSCWSKQINTCSSYLQMHMFECMTNELYERNGSCLHLKEIIQFLKAYHYTLQYVDKFHFYVMYTKT